MGFRIKTGSWRAPLQIIDSFLPRRPPSMAVIKPAQTRKAQGLFRRAGWLGRSIRLSAANETCFSQGAQAVSRPAERPLRPVRVVRVTSMADPARQEARLVISGRMSDVCAELDRLAAIESRMATA
ncbi:MAG: hypothetical protein ACLGG8_03050 [Gammaproteobacteria bacterium]